MPDAYPGMYRLATLQLTFCSVLLLTLTGCDKSSGTPDRQLVVEKHEIGTARKDSLEADNDYEINFAPEYNHDVRQELLIELNKKLKLADNFREFANSIDSNVHLGTPVNEVDVPQHRCIIISKLLGISQYTLPLQKSYNPDYNNRTEENAYDLRLEAQSIDNFRVNLINLAIKNSRKLKLIWNLDCQKIQGVKQYYFNDVKGEVYFDVSENGELVTVLGDIGDGFSSKLAGFLKENPKVTTLALGSGGGSVLDAISAGYLIRSNSLNTTLYSECYSACTLLFIGGKERTIWSPYPSLGFHKIYDGKTGTPIGLDHPLYQAILVYISAMGVDPSYVIGSMQQANPDQMLLAEGDHLCRAKVATWVQRLCSSEDTF